MHIDTSSSTNALHEGYGRRLNMDRILYLKHHDESNAEAEYNGHGVWRGMMASDDARKIHFQWAW